MGSFLSCPIQNLNWELYNLESGKRLWEGQIELMEDIKGAYILTASWIHSNKKPAHKLLGVPHHRSTPTGPWAPTVLCMPHTPLHPTLPSPCPVASSLGMILTMS